MHAIKAPSNTSITRYFKGLISLVIVFMIIDAIQSQLTNHALDFFFDVFTDPIVFVVWTLYWLSTTFETTSFSYFRSAFKVPKGKKWWLEVMVLFILTFALSIALLLIADVIISHYFPSIYNESTLPILPQSRILAGLSLVFATTSSVIVKPFLEELLFRGVFLSHLKNRYSAFKAMILLSAIFAVCHMDPIGAFVFSMVTCILTLKYESLVPSVVLHVANNFVCNVPIIMAQLSPNQPSSESINFSVLPYALCVLVLSGVCLALYVRTYFKNEQ